MRYQLTQGPDFEMPGGPFKGQLFERGKRYASIPEEMADRFTDMTPPEVPGQESEAPAKPKKERKGGRKP